jgi:hypothetical protein
MKAMYGIISQRADKDSLLNKMIFQINTQIPQSKYHITTKTASIDLLSRSSQEKEATFYEKGNLTIVVTGNIFHKDFPRKNIFSFLINIYEKKQLARISECLGEFNVLIIDSSKDSITLINDYLSIRPLFYYNDKGTFIFGSDVWPMIASGCIPYELNLDAFCSWLTLGHTLKNASLFHHLQKMSPSTILTYSEGKLKQEQYNSFNFTERPTPENEAIETIHYLVSDSCQQMTTNVDTIGCFLSGGFDSRYILGLLQKKIHHLDLYIVNGNSADQEAAKMVVETLGLNANVSECPKSLYDLYNPPHHFAPWGFPMGKFYTILPVQKYNIHTLLADGLLGDDIIRSYDYERRVLKLSLDYGSLAEGLYISHLARDPNTIFQSGLSHRIKARTVSQIAEFCDTVEGNEERKGYLWLLLNRKNNYHTNNHLQYLDYTETIHPFVSKNLIEYRLQTPVRLFRKEFYRKILQKYLPKIGSLPHSSELEMKYDSANRFSHYFWKKTPKVLAEILKESGNEIFKTKWLIPRITSYFTGHAGNLYLVKYLLSLFLLSDCLKKANISIKWNDI